MITVKNINGRPESIPDTKFGNNSDENYFYFFESEEEKASYYASLPPQVEVKNLNWEQLKKDLYVSPLFSKAFAQANDKAFTLFRAELIDGMNGNGNEVELKVFINMMGLTFTDSEKLELNKILTDNNFTIQI